MRILLFIFLLISLSFSSYDEPPIEQVRADNLIRAVTLNDSYNPQEGISSHINYFFNGSADFQSLRVNMSAEIAGLSTTIDNATGHENIEVIIRRGHSMAELDILPGADEKTIYDLRGQHCNRSAIPVPPASSERWSLFVTMCDHDGDSCGEATYEKGMDYNLQLTMEFRDRSVTVPVNDKNVIRVPGWFEDIMENSSGLENLTLRLGGNASFWYVFNDMEPYEFGAGCDRDNYVNSSRLTFHINDEKSYRVEGKQKIFFLEAPVLREQWFRSNRFNVGVFSQSQVHKSASFLNNNLSCTFDTADFEVATGDGELEQITSVRSATNATCLQANYTATPLSEDNSTFGYYCLFPCSYEGIGRNNLSIEVSDYWKNNESYDEVILSRSLSYSNKSNELGNSISANDRPSASVRPSELSFVSISAGMLGVLLLVLLANRWFLLERGNQEEQETDPE